MAEQEDKLTSAPVDEVLRQSEQRYSAFIRNSSEAIWRFELDAPVSVSLPPAEQIEAFYRHSYLAECNEAMARLYGYSRPEDLIGLRLGQLMPKSNPANVKYLEAFIAGGHQLSEAESVEVARDGSTRHVLNSLRGVIENGAIVRAWGTSRDISARKEAERRLQQSEEQFRLMVESASDYAIFATDFAGVITTWNVGAERILGFSSDEVVGKSTEILFTPEDVARDEPAKEMKTALERDRAADERWHLKKGGERFWASGLLMPMRDGDGRVMGFLKILRDMTARREADEARQKYVAGIEELNQTLERRVSERTAALSEANNHLRAFAHTVAHDLRAPARAVAQYCEILLQDHRAELNRRAIDVVQRIQNASHRMEILIASVLDYSRTLRADLKLEPVKMREVLNGVIERQMEMIQHTGARIDLGDEFPTVLAHRGLLSQAMENIIANALKFVPEGRRPQLSIWAFDRRGRSRFYVRDNGVGVAPEDRERIFGVFERVGRANEFAGTGIGLAIVKAAMERMGGSVGLESTLGNGSVFWLEFATAPTTDSGS